MEDQTSPSSGAGREDERVRFCLRCGAVLPFEDRVCGSCGHVDPVSPDANEVQQVVFCLACGGDVPVGLSFCGQCGRPLEPPVVPWTGRTPEGRPDEGTGLATAAWVLALLGPAILLAALVSVLRAG